MRRRSLNAYWETWFMGSSDVCWSCSYLCSRIRATSQFIKHLAFKNSGKSRNRIRTNQQIGKFTRNIRRFSCHVTKSNTKWSQEKLQKMEFITSINLPLTTPPPALHLGNQKSSNIGPSFRLFPSKTLHVQSRFKRYYLDREQTEGLTLLSGSRGVLWHIFEKSGAKLTQSPWERNLSKEVFRITH